jgi:hypothetical protein
MKLKVESWLDDKKYSENVNVLFKDSIICYKSGANRASLLFSYLGFMTILKEIIISSNKPLLFPQGEWDLIIRKLQNEDTWEANVFDATQQQEKIDVTTKARTKDPIFNINENLRIQIKYWKDRRNDCAHYKDNIIESFHVESFWAFLESNLPKISVEGGMQSLIIKIQKHFDPTYTPPGKDVAYLVKEIEHSVEILELKEFWQLFLDDSGWSYYLSDAILDFLNRSIEINSEKINEPLIDLLKSKEYYLKEFLDAHPDKIQRLGFNEEDIRKFWKTTLIRCNNILGIYTTLLRNRLIPDTEIKEANEVIFAGLHRFDVTPLEFDLLKANGFLDTFKSNIINNSKFNEYQWVNDRADLISDVIKLHPADKDIIMKLCEVYSQSTNSNWLLERFENIFIPESDLTKDYKKIIVENSITVPSKLAKYFD